TEGRAPGDAGALGDDRSTVKLDEVTHDRQPEAEPAIWPRRPGLGLAEALEDVRQEGSLDADAGVGDEEIDGAVALDPAQSHRHHAAARRELDRVGEQVPHHLL